MDNIISGISIILCCYNSADRLEVVLTYLAKLKLPKDTDVELIVVNNNSTDGTKGIAKEIWTKLEEPFPIQIVDEEISGLSYARNKGVITSKYNILVFCDDDNWLEESYLNIVSTRFKSDNSIAIIGGYGEAETIIQKPKWFDKFAHGFAVSQQGLSEDFVDSVFGAGMCIKKNIYLQSQEIFGSLKLTGRKGKNLSAGEDSEICARIKLLGYKILYSPDLQFKHFISSNRLKWDYLLNLHVGFAKTFIVLHLYDLALKKKTISNLYWLKQSLFYFARVIKYLFLYFPKLINKTEGSVEEVRIRTWYVIAIGFLNYNVKLKKELLFLESLKLND